MIFMTIVGGGVFAVVGFAKSYKKGGINFTVFTIPLPEIRLREV